MNDPAAITGLVDALVGAINAGDRVACMNLLDATAREFLPASPPIEDTRIIEQTIERLFSGRRNDLRVEMDDVQATGDQGICSGTFSLRSTDRETGAIVYIDGKFLAVAVLRVSGWRISHFCYNENVPRP